MVNINKDNNIVNIQVALFKETDQKYINYCYSDTFGWKNIIIIIIKMQNIIKFNKNSFTINGKVKWHEQRVLLSSIFFIL